MRCNIIEPCLLTDQHLIAERRELRLIPPLFEKRFKKLGIKGVVSNIPDQYCLGKGHMLFWMNKGEYLRTRYSELTDEMLIRGFKPDLSIFYFLTPEARDVSIDYVPSTHDIQILLERVTAKINQKPTWYRFHGNPITEEYILHLNEITH
jgi:deoxyribonuclease (pyrimidine dimer)